MMLQKLLSTDKDLASLVLRIALGVLIFPHGAQKLLGWFGGSGYAGTIQYFTENLGIPYILALIVIVTEFFGGIALVAGLATRLSALGVGAIMVVALFMHVDNGFFMNWSGNQQGEGIEFHLLAIAMSFALTWKGGGLLSIDGFLASRAKSP